MAEEMGIPPTPTPEVLAAYNALKEQMKTAIAELTAKHADELQAQADAHAKALADQGDANAAEVAAIADAVGNVAAQVQARTAKGREAAKAKRLAELDAEAKRIREE